MLAEIIERNLDRLSSNVVEVLTVDCSKDFYKALDRSFAFGNRGVSYPFWNDKIGSKTFFKLVARLKSFDLIKINKNGNYVTISLNEVKLISLGEDVFKHRSDIKIKQYLLNSSLLKVDTRVNLVSSNKSIKQTGLVRGGFINCSLTEFKFDKELLNKYLKFININNTKSISEVLKKYPEISEDSVNFLNVSEEIIKYYLKSNQWFNLGGNVSDSRGRAIYKGTGKIFNPVTAKEARSLLIFKKASNLSINNKFALDRIFLFIAEFDGEKFTSWNDKLEYGKELYRNKTLPKVRRKYNKLGKKSGWKDVEERIWLERIYTKLDELFDDGEVYWDIPIEIDATASMIQMMGVILNNFDLLNATNVICPDDLQDFWNVPEDCKYITRDGVKAIFTPRLYGSKASNENLLKAKDIEPTKGVLVDAEYLEKDDRFKLPMLLRDFFIDFSNIKRVYNKNTESFNVKIDKEEFFVEINKFKEVYSEPKIYEFPSNNIDGFGLFENQIKYYEPDFDRFKTYLFTLFIHNLDSQGANKVALDNPNIITIHDAFLCLPQNVEGVLKSYKGFLQHLRNNGWEIFKNYCLSIGMKEAFLDWNFNNPDPILNEKFKDNQFIQDRLFVLKQIKESMNTAEGYIISDSCLK